MRRVAVVVLTIGTAVAQRGGPERLVEAAKERAMATQVARMGTDERIQFYQALAAHQAEDTRYRNMLALTYIQKTRETQDFSYLDRADRLVQEVLSGDAANYEAQRVRSQIYLERHEFRKAAENSSRLIEREPEDAYNYGTLGDALTELGEYDKAAAAYQKMVNLSPGLSSYNRASYYRFLYGDAKGAVEVMKAAAAAGSPAMPESMAWCLAQLGGLYFHQGDLERAEQAFAEALRVFPNHYEALAGMGRVAAARLRFDQAIDYMKRSVAVVPMIDHVAWLADYYELAGKKQQAEEQWRLVEFLDRLGEINKEVHNRNLAMVYANHDLRLDKALQLALRELEVRGDLYTWDAIAWAYYKNKKYVEAEQAIGKALALNTPDPALHYHAGMIARARGNDERAKQHLARALALNPQFDARQGPLAKKALEELAGVPAPDREPTRADAALMLDRNATIAARNEACGRLSGTEAVSLFERALEEPEVRACAATQLRRLGAASALRRALQSGEPEVRARAIYELGAMKDSDAIDGLVAAARDSDPLVSSVAVHALLEFEDQRVLPALLEVASRQGVSSLPAVTRLARFRDPRVPPALYEVLKSQDPLLRIAAIGVLGEVGDRKTLAKLEPLLSDRNELHPTTGLGFFPSVSMARAARVAIERIRSREKETTNAEQ